MINRMHFFSDLLVLPQIGNLLKADFAGVYGTVGGVQHLDVPSRPVGLYKERIERWLKINADCCALCYVVRSIVAFDHRAKCCMTSEV
jgi:hypothetical protein